MLLMDTETLKIELVTLTTYFWYIGFQCGTQFEVSNWIGTGLNILRWHHAPLV